MHGKNIPLEALRGIAALVVMFGHIVAGFFPAYTRFYEGPNPSGFKIEAGPWFAFLNAEAAVIFFFVLSGYVLTKRYFETGEVSILVNGAIKRWPRLAGIVIPVVLVSCALMMAGLYFSQEAARISGSIWLARVGPLTDPTAPNFIRALLQSSVLTFFRGDSSYDPAIWTMKHEFYGSLGIFALAYAVFVRPERIRRNAILTIMMIAAILFARYFAAFVFGLTIALVFTVRPFKLPLHTALSGLVISFLLASVRNTGTIPALYHPIVLDTYIYIAGSVLTIISVLGSPKISYFLSGKLPEFLGRISFPLYVLHLPILLSLGSFLFIQYGSVVASLATASAAIMSAIPLSRVDIRWVSLLNRTVRERTHLLDDHFTKRDAVIKADPS